MPVLEFECVSRIHGTGAAAVVALAEVSLAADPGEFVALMGQSGSGKSTLLHLAGGLDTPTSGDVRVLGQSVPSLSLKKRAALRRRSVGYVFQDYNLVPGLTAAENAALPLELDGWPRRKAQAEACKLLERVGIAELANRRPQDMSGGQAQRVAIARALVGERRLLLADEPTGALDTVSGDDILEILRERADEGATVLLVTHEPRFAAWADRTIFLSDGRIVDEASGTSFEHGPGELS